MTLPNFLGIGVQRAATTWLHACLSEHPEVFVPEAKELHFFSSRFDRGLRWYEDHFAGAEGYTAVGEITPTYLHEAPLARIADTLPHARIVIVLREPVERAYSAYRLFHERHAGMTFQEACARSGDLLSYSLYAHGLASVYQQYPPDRIKVLLYDDITADPQAVLRDVFEFLQVDSRCVPRGASRTFNRILFPRTQRFLSRAGLGWTIEAVKSTRLGEWIKLQSRIRRPETDGSIDPVYRKELTAFFRADILRVQEMIGRDLSRWLR